MPALCYSDQPATPRLLPLHRLRSIGALRFLSGLAKLPFGLAVPVKAYSIISAHIVCCVGSHIMCPRGLSKCPLGYVHQFSPQSLALGDARAELNG